MVICVYLLIILATVTQSASTKLFNRTSEPSCVFNAIKAGSAFLILALVAVWGFSFNWQTLLYGTLYGASLSLSMYAGYRALCCGPMALTSMLVSFSVVIPLIWGITVCNERLTAMQYPALVLLFLAIILTNLDKFKTKRETKSNYALWLTFVGLTFICNGLGSILQKQHQVLYPNLYSREFMVFAMLFCTLVYSISLIVKIPLRELKSIKGKKYGVFSGITTAIASFLTLVLAGMENASVLFPLISAGTILASLFCGKLLFKEKLKLNHYFALLTGITAAILFKL